jgi:glycolate oxidase iron-sulfur subunit
MESARYLSEISKCVRCGVCKAICPTYDEDSTEAMGARGRIALLRALSSGQIAASGVLNDRIFSCTLCGACSGLCPPRVDIKEVFYHGRSLLKKTDKKRRYLRFFTSFCTKRPKLSFKLLSVTQHILFPYLSKKGLLPFQPELPLPERRLEDNMRVFTVSKKKGRVAIFTGCIVNFLYPHLRDALINVLHKLAYEVVLPANEVCCGVPLRTLGLEKEAVELAKKNLAIFGKLNVEAVLSLCPTCTLAIRDDYQKLAGEGIDKAMDISSFLIEKLDPSQFSQPFTDFKSAIYHDPCHLKYGLGVVKEPREIIKNIGLDVLKTEGERCCGFAGIFCFTNKELSQGLLNKCIKDYAGSGADTIITSCPGCMLQIMKDVKNKPVVHLIEVIEAALFQ